MQDKDILYAAADRLKSRFDCPVYTDPVRQGFQAPCFFVKTDAYTQKKCIGPRYENSCKVVIEFVEGDVRDRRAKSADTAQALFTVFETLTAAGETYRCFEQTAERSNIARGFDRGFEHTDELIRFTFRLHWFTRAVEREDDENAPMLRYAADTTFRNAPQGARATE